jgi:Flp pilus assembly pilin Flp
MKVIPPFQSREASVLLVEYVLIAVAFSVAVVTILHGISV